MKKWLDKYENGENELPKAQVGDNTYIKKPPVLTPIGPANDPDVKKYFNLKKDETWGSPYEFMMNWYSNPTTKAKLKSQGFTGNPMTEALNQKLFKDYRDWKHYQEHKNREAAEGIYSDDYENKLRFENELNKTTDLLYENQYQTTAGFHNPSDSTVAINKRWDRDHDQRQKTAVHELTHATPLDNYYTNYFKTKKPKNPKAKEKEYFDKDPEEIYPRIMDLRFQMNLKPGRRVTPDMLEGYYNDSDYDLKNYYSPKELADIMNEIAYNPKTKLSKAQNGIEGTMGGLTDKGFNYNGAWGGPSMQMGGNLQPPMAGARTQGIPSEGPYGKKTVPSAQNGQEMQFYQNGLDWTPRNISEYGSEIPMAQPGITQPMRGDIQTRGNQNLLTEIAAQRTKEKKAQEARTRTTIGADTRTSDERQKAREFTEQVDKRRKEMGIPEGTGYLKDREKAKRILSNVMTPLEAASYVTGVGSIGSNFLRLGASALEKQIGKNLVSKGLKNATSYINPIINKADEALAYVQLDPIGIMGNKLNRNLYNPTTAINRANNTITGIDKNLKNSAVETADLIVGENNAEILFDKIINPLPDDILKYLDDTKPPLFIRALGKIVPPGTSIVAPGLYAQVLNQSLSEEDKSKLPTFAKEHLEKMANQFNIDSKLKQKKKGGIVKDDNGYWNPDNWGKIVEIDSPNITMQGVNQDLIGVSDTGDIQYMTPGNDYTFDGDSVTEYPVAKYGVNQQDEKTVQHLDQLLNFTNKPKAKNGWLDKYK